MVIPVTPGRIPGCRSVMELGSGRPRFRVRDGCHGGTSRSPPLALEVGYTQIDVSDPQSPLHYRFYRLSTRDRVSQYVEKGGGLSPLPGPPVPRLPRHDAGARDQDLGRSEGAADPRVVPGRLDVTGPEWWWGPVDHSATPSFPKTRRPQCSLKECRL